MNQPYLNMFEPDKKDYNKRKREIVLYEYFESWKEKDECRYCGNPDCDGSCEDADRKWSWRDKDQPEICKDPLTTMNLQKILDLAPPETALSDIKIKTSLTSWDYPDGHTITFYYTKTLPADPEGYKRDLAKYKAAYADYEKKKAVYDQLIKEQQVKELEEKLAQLKK